MNVPKNLDWKLHQHDGISQSGLASYGLSSRPCCGRDPRTWLCLQVCTSAGLTAGPRTHNLAGDKYHDEMGEDHIHGGLQSLTRISCGYPSSFLVALSLPNT